MNAQGTAPLISAKAQRYSAKSAVANSAKSEKKKAVSAVLLPHAEKGKAALLKAGSKSSLANALLPTSRNGKISFLDALRAAAQAKSGKNGEPALAKDLAAAKKKAVDAKTAQTQGTATPAFATEVKSAEEPGAKAQPKKKAADAAAVPVHAAAAARVTQQQAVSDSKKAGAAADQGLGPAAAASARSPRKPEPKLVVVDLRKKGDAKTSGREGTTDALKLPSQQVADKDGGTQFSQRLGALRDGMQEADQKQPAAPAAPQSAGQDALERLRQMAGSELVRASNMILKDGGGEIRLVLKPESMGSIRIRMNLVDNHIEGRIVVDSSAVKHVVDGSIDALMRALTAEGFQTGALQVSVGGQNAHSERQMQEPPPGVQRVVAEGFERNVPGIENLSLGDLLVNLFV